MSRIKRAKYDLEYRRAVAQMMLDGQSPAQLSRDLGLSRGMLYRWKDELLASASSSVAVLPASRSAQDSHHQDLSMDVKALAAENSLLRRKLQVAEQEREILKKALSVVNRLE